MEIFVARQPIFNKKMEIYGYELLYRSNAEKNLYDNFDGNKASSDVIAASFLVTGLNTLTGGRKAFINFTELLLKEQIATILPKENLIIEILETIDPSVEIVEACRGLKKMGYSLALDDFVFDKKYKELIEISDIIKIDFLNTDAYQRECIIKHHGKQRIRYLAEKIESQEDFNQAVKLGYSLFQGYYFSKPTILSSKEVPPYKFNSIELVKLVNQDEPDFKKIAKVIEKDVSLSFSLLKLINSLAFYRGNRIKSVLQATTMLGINELRKWVSLVAIRKICEDQPDELTKMSIVRAKFCEMAAMKMGFQNRETELFLMGLFSLIDTLMNRPLNEIISDLPLSEDVKAALLYESGTFKDIYKLMQHYEHGEWDSVVEIIHNYGISEPDIAGIYINSIKWVEENVI